MSFARQLKSNTKSSPLTISGHSKMHTKPIEYMLKYIIGLKSISNTSVLQPDETSFESQVREVCPYCNKILSQIRLPPKIE